MGFSGKLAELFVEIGTKDKTKQELGVLRRDLSSWAGSARRMLTLPVTIASGIGGAAATKFLWDSVHAASDLNETMSKTHEVFGDSTNQVTKFADTMADKFGLVKTQVLDAASMFGLILQGSGMTAQASAQLSVQLAQLAADASSFYNVPVDVALEKIRAGLSGEAEPLRAFGVMLSQDAVEAKALEMGLATSMGAMEEQTKVAVRAKLIMEGLGKASGDLDRTQDGLANQMRKAEGDLKNFESEIGKELIPALLEAIKLFERLGGAMSGASSSGAKGLGQEMTAWTRALNLLTGGTPNVGPGGPNWLKSLMVGASDTMNEWFHPGTENQNQGRDYAFNMIVESIAKSSGLALSAGPVKPQDTQQGQRAQKAKADLDARNAAEIAAIQAQQRGGMAAPPGDFGTAEMLRKGMIEEINRRLQHEQELASKEGRTSDEITALRKRAALTALEKAQGTPEQMAFLARERDKARRADTADALRDKIADKQREIRDEIEDRRKKLAQGQVYGSQESAYGAIQQAALDLPQKQLKAAQDQLAKLEEIRKAVVDNKPGALKQAGTILKGRE